VDRNRILVSPLRVSGDSALAQLGELVQVLLSAQLTGEGGPAAIDRRETLSAQRRAGPGDDGEVQMTDFSELPRNGRSLV
jgi:hypothetical protein